VRGEEAGGEWGAEEAYKWGRRGNAPGTLQSQELRKEKKLTQVELNTNYLMMKGQEKAVRAAGNPSGSPEDKTRKFINCDWDL